MDETIDYFKLKRDSLMEPFLPVPDNPIGNLAVVYKNGEYYRMDTHYSTAAQVTQLINVEWNQDFPYNYFCPTVNTSNQGYYPSLQGKAAVGCVPIAIGQIMSYHEYPLVYDTITFNWNLIKFSPYYNNISPESMETAKLLYRVGLCASVDYGYESSANFLNAQSALGQMGYSFEASSFSRNKVISSLNNLKPVYIRGTSPDGGHAWVIDGYRIMRYWKDYYTVDPPYTYCFNEYEDTDYFHCNWGWGGNYNGYFLNTFRIYKQDGTSLPFNGGNKIIYDIEPYEP